MAKFEGAFRYCTQITVINLAYVLLIVADCLSPPQES
jgi:hypothetical protein